jgi:hypothetical protein
MLRIPYVDVVVGNAEVQTKVGEASGGVKPCSVCKRERGIGEKGVLNRIENVEEGRATP